MATTKGGASWDLLYKQKETKAVVKKLNTYKQKTQQKQGRHWFN